jgi:hypothetical protein
MLALEASQLARNDRDCDGSQLWWYLRSGSAIWLPGAPSRRTALNHVIADRAIADDGSSRYAWAMPGASSRCGGCFQKRRERSPGFIWRRSQDLDRSASRSYNSCIIGSLGFRLVVQRMTAVKLYAR